MLHVVFKNPNHLDTPLAQPFVIDESLFGVLTYIEKANEGLLKYEMSFFWQIFLSIWRVLFLGGLRNKNPNLLMLNSKQNKIWKSWKNQIE